MESGSSTLVRMMKRASVQLSLVLSLFVSGCDGLLPLPGSPGGVQWAHGAPRIKDLNGDGELDVFGWVNAWNGQFNPRIAGYDGKTGDRLWITPVIGALGEPHNARMGLFGETLIVADAGGTARAFRPGEDAPIWSTVLGERTTRLCTGAPGQVVAQMVDNRTLTLDLATGAAQPISPPTSCVLDEYPQAAFRPDRDERASEQRTGPIDVDRWRTEQKALDAEKERLDALAPGLKRDAILVVNPELQVFIGAKREGTRVPMIALVRGESLAWSQVVPADEPLRARNLSQLRATADARAVFVGYQLLDTDRIAAFALADGERLWDIPIPQTPEDSPRIDALALAPGRLYVAHLTYLSALDRATGEVLHTIGQRR